jgi:hypothetical protein
MHTLAACGGFESVSFKTLDLNPCRVTHEYVLEFVRCSYSDQKRKTACRWEYSRYVTCNTVFTALEHEK